MSDDKEKFDFEKLKTMTEAELRDLKVPWFDSVSQVNEFTQALVERQHDYGTRVYAMSLTATAMFNFVAGKLGVTGFQASCADMDFLARSRSMKHGFKITDYGNLFYPQYWDRAHFPEPLDLVLGQPEYFLKEAERLIGEGSRGAHENVVAHWRMLAEKCREAIASKNPSPGVAAE